MKDLVYFLIMGVLSVFGMLAQAAAYRNGVTDGYGFSKEPNNPGYQRAGAYLRKYLAHRWSELAGGDTRGKHQ